MSQYEELRAQFEANADEKTAEQMAAFRRGLFAFYGLKAGKRKELSKEWIKEARKRKVVDWDLLDECYADEHREFQYFVWMTSFCPKRLRKARSRIPISIHFLHANAVYRCHVTCTERTMQKFGKPSRGGRGNSKAAPGRERLDFCLIRDRAFCVWSARVLEENGLVCGRPVEIPCARSSSARRRIRA